MSERLTADELAVLRDFHQQHDSDPEMCRFCRGMWPCDTTRLLGHIAAIEAELAAMWREREQLRSMLVRGPGCALCDGMGGTFEGGLWQVCPNCQSWEPHPPATVAASANPLTTTQPAPGDEGSDG